MPATTERTVGEAGLAARGLAEDPRAARALDDGLGVAEQSLDVAAARALDVHEERVGRLYQALELVLAQLGSGVRVQKVNGQLRAALKLVAG